MRTDRGELTDISRYWLVLSLFRAGDDLQVIPVATSIIENDDRPGW